MKLAPAVVSTLLLMLVMSRFRSPWALPAVLIFIPGVFFVVLACLHKSLAQAQDGGWVARPQVSLAYITLDDACHYVGSLVSSARNSCAIWVPMVRFVFFVLQAGLLVSLA